MHRAISIAALLVSLAGCGKPDCNALYAEQVGLSSAFASGCNSDVDRTVVSGATSCFLQCGAVVRVGQEQAYAAQLAGFDQQNCASSGCHAGPECGAIPVERCVQGVCQ